MYYNDPKIEHLLNCARGNLPSSIDIQCYRAAEFDGYIFRCYNIKTHETFEINIKQISLVVGEFQEVLQKILNTISNKWDSKLHRAMR